MMKKNLEYLLWIPYFKNKKIKYTPVWNFYKVFTKQDFYKAHIFLTNNISENINKNLNRHFNK